MRIDYPGCIFNPDDESELQNAELRPEISIFLS